MAAGERISLPDLAAELRCNPDRLLPLIEHGYLRQADTNSVEKPPPAAIEWLRNMLAPLPRKPLLMMEEAAHLLKMPAADLRGFLVHYNIQAFSDPVFGELVSIAGLRKLGQRLESSRHDLRMDAQQLLFYSITHLGVAGGLHSLPYSVELNEEIIRISRLDNPLRALCAAALIEAWKSAQAVASCLDGYRENLNNLVFRNMKELEESLYGEEPKPKPKPKKKPMSAAGLKRAIDALQAKYIERLGATGEGASGEPASGASCPSDTSSGS